MPKNRLTDMDYDEVSLVDSGACDDAHILLTKRAPQVLDLSKAYQKSPNESSSGTSQRAANWQPARHPRVPAGKSGGGQFASTSAASKRKYGKGGTAKDNVPTEYQTSNKEAQRLGLEHSPSASQEKLLASAGSKGSKGKKGSKKKSKKQTKQQALQAAMQRARSMQQRTNAQVAARAAQTPRKSKPAQRIQRVSVVHKNLEIGEDGNIGFSSAILKGAAPDWSTQRILDQWLNATEGSEAASCR